MLKEQRIRTDQASIKGAEPLQLAKRASVAIQTKVGELTIEEEQSHGGFTDYKIRLEQTGSSKKRDIGKVQVTGPWLLSDLEGKNYWNQLVYHGFKELGLKDDDRTIRVGQFDPLRDAPELKHNGIGTKVLNQLITWFRSDGLSGVSFTHPSDAMIGLVDYVCLKNIRKGKIPNEVILADIRKSP